MFGLCFPVLSAYEALSVNSCQQQDAQIRERGRLDHPAGGPSSVGHTDSGAHTPFGGDRSSASRSLVVFGVCFVSFIMCLVASPCLLVFWKDFRAAQPRGHARLRKVSVEEDALVFSSS